jgi:hypothetical protein
MVAVVEYIHWEMVKLEQKKMDTVDRADLYSVKKSHHYHESKVEIKGMVTLC